jgi:hypothetical protein
MTTDHLDRLAAASAVGRETVTRAEFVRRCREAGMTPARAESTAHHAALLRSPALIGGVLLKIGDSPE